MRRLAAFLLIAFLVLAAPAGAQEWDDIATVPEAGVAAPPADVGEPLEEGDAPFDEGEEATVTEWGEPAVAPAPALPLVTGRTVRGTTAQLRVDGKAAIPRGVPKRVRALISSLNEIVGKPYKWGGGHGALVDRGYDCSGAIGYGLIKVGVQRGPMVSGQFARWGSGGDGRWVTIFAHGKHAYMEVAGLRLDTSPVGDPTGRHGVRWRPVIGRRPGFHARHPVGF